MNPSDYVAVVGLYTKTGQVVALPGERCDRVPAASLAWLAAGDLIRLEPAEAPKRTKGRE